VYDACQSGSFLPALKPVKGKERIVIASSREDESAFFLTQGTISFSHYFWGGIFNGATVYDAFTASKNAMETGGFQTALLDDNGNGEGNEKTDGALADEYIIGYGATTGADYPVIASIMAPLTLRGEISASLWVKDITSSSPVLTVWAVIKGPEESTDNASQAITDLPAIPLLPADNGEYRGTYSGFTARGTYSISVYAQDTQGAFSFPVTTSVIQTKGTLCPAMVAAGSNSAAMRSLRAFRDTILSATPEGRSYISLYYKHARELSALLLNNRDIRTKAVLALSILVPAAEASMLQKKVPPLASGQKKIITDAVQSIYAHASRGLREDIDRKNFRKLFPENLMLSSDTLVPGGILETERR